MPEAAWAGQLRRDRTSGSSARWDEVAGIGGIGALDGTVEAPATAKSMRVRDGKRVILDGPYAEAKEVLGGFNLIEAADMDEALEIAKHFPWASTGCIEVRPVRGIQAVRDRVGA